MSGFYWIFFKNIWRKRFELGDYLCRKHKITNNEIDSTVSSSSQIQSQTASNYSVNESGSIIESETTDLNNNNIESIELNNKLIYD